METTPRTHFCSQVPWPLACRAVVSSAVTAASGQSGARAVPDTIALTLADALRCPEQPQRPFLSLEPQQPRPGAIVVAGCHGKLPWAPCSGLVSLPRARGDPWRGACATATCPVPRWLLRRSGTSSKAQGQAQRPGQPDRKVSGHCFHGSHPWDRTPGSPGMELPWEPLGGADATDAGTETLLGRVLSTGLITQRRFCSC